MSTTCMRDDSSRLLASVVVFVESPETDNVVVTLSKLDNLEELHKVEMKDAKTRLIPMDSKGRRARGTLLCP